MSKDFYSIWATLTEALWDLTDTHPAIGMLCRKWAYQIATEPQEVETPSDETQTQHSPFNIQSRGLTCDIVFVPSQDRTNYLGTCLSLLDAFTQSHPHLAAGILTTGLSEKALRHLVLNEDWPLLSGPFFRGPLLRHMPEVHQLTVALEERLEHHSELSVFFQQNRTEKYQRLSHDLDKIGAYKHWLSAINCKCIVTTNEQLEPASHIICAAKELGIETIQILHGIPTRLYTPMLSDQLWLWHEDQKEIFQNWGIEPRRLHVAGFLEPLTAFHQPSPQTDDTDDSQNILFASQWQGSELWEVPHFQNATHWVASSDIPQEVNLQVRFHPHDTKDDKNALKSLFASHHSHVDYFDANDTALAAQLQAASKVITASSTVGFISCLMGIPTAIIWDESLEKLHGAPAFPNATVICNDRQLQEFIQKPIVRDRNILENFNIKQSRDISETAQLLGEEVIRKSTAGWAMSATSTGEQLLPQGPDIRFGIVIPNLNQGSFLQAAIESVLAQDWPHVSCVIMDGGSADDSTEIIRRYEGQVHNAHIGPDAGQTHAIARGFHQLPEATHLMWLNSDDRMLPGALSAFAEVIQKNPRYGLYIGGGWQIFSESQRKLIVRENIEWPQIRNWPHHYFLQPATIISRTAYEAVLGVNPDVDHAMDYDLWIRVLHHHKAKCFSKPVCEVHMHPAQKTARLRPEVLWETLALCFDDGGRADALQLASHFMRHESQFNSWIKSKGIALLSSLSKRRRSSS